MAPLVDCVVFPGQGSQRPGMGLDFAQRFPASRRIFDEAADALGLDVAALCAADDGRLNLTENAQPCIVAAEIAMLRALEGLGLAPRCFGGHSLGEYSALVAAGAVPFASALRLVRTRGRLMQAAAPQGWGAMIAVIQPGLDHALVARCAEDAGADVANDNSPSQLVVSGPAAAVQAVQARLEPVLAPAGGRVVPLDVSAPFHSRAMAPVEAPFGEALRAEAPSFDAARARLVTSNFTGGFHSGTLPELCDALVRQISGRVRWQENMRALAGQATRIFEVGPNRPLSRFFSEVGSSVVAIHNVRTAEKAQPFA